MQSHKVSFATNIATKQIANISPSNTPTSQHKAGTNHKDNEDDTPLDDFDGTTPNQEWWDNDKLLLANPKQGYMVNSQITNGLFMKACMEICHGLDNFTANATIATQAHKEVIANEGQFYPEQCIKFIGKQPTLFPFLAITGPNNQVVVLHLGYTTLRSLFASIYKTKIC